MNLKFYTDEGKSVYSTYLSPRQKRTDIQRVSPDIQEYSKNQSTKDLLKSFFSMYHKGQNSYDFWKWFNPVRLRGG